MGYSFWLLLPSGTVYTITPAGPPVTKWTDDLPQDLVKSRSREIESYIDRISLQFDRHLGSTAADVLVKFQSDMESLNPNPVATRLQEILRLDVGPLKNRVPDVYCWSLAVTIPQLEGIATMNWEIIILSVMSHCSSVSNFSSCQISSANNLSLLHLIRRSIAQKQEAGRVHLPICPEKK